MTTPKKIRGKTEHTHTAGDRGARTVRRGAPPRLSMRRGAKRNTETSTSVPANEVEAPESDVMAAPEFPEAGEALRAQDESDGPESDVSTLSEEVLAESVTARPDRDDEVQSFLAMYFRDMAQLDVLRPEEEFETARNIEALEIELWKLLLSYTSVSAWVVAIVERAMEKPLASFKVYQKMADELKVRSPAAQKKRFEHQVEKVATELRELDIDRIFVDAVMAQVHRALAIAPLDKAGRAGFPFDILAKGFREFVHGAINKQVAVKRAKNGFVRANLRLVVSIARRFNHGRLPLPDLIQEGNIGLMKAVERYDYRRGFRFSTYASWWIRHAISRGLADKGRAVRLPVHMIDAYHRLAKSERQLQTTLNRPPTNEELSVASGLEVDKLEKMRMFLNESPISLDRPVSDDDGRKLIDMLESPEEQTNAPEMMAVTETHDEMIKLLGSLKPIEADILRKRFGLFNDQERTLKEIGDEYHLSRERVRQLQEQALGKMRRALGKREDAA